MNIQKILNLLNKEMTDAEIGEAIGLSQPTVTRLRNGVHKRTFHADAIRKLAQRKGVLKSNRRAI